MASAPPGPDRGGGTALAPGERPALIVIDFVNAYLERSSPLYAAVEPVRERCIELLGAARAARVLVIHTNVRYQAQGADGGVFYRKLPALACFNDPLLGAFGPGLEALPGELVISKQYASAFHGTSLAATLTAARIDTLLIAGVTTSGCIRATAVDACQHGFIPLVVREAVGDRPDGTHEANLSDLQRKYAEVVPLEAMRAYLARSGTPPAV